MRCVRIDPNGSKQNRTGLKSSKNCLLERIAKTLGIKTFTAIFRVQEQSPTIKLHVCKIKGTAHRAFHQWPSQNHFWSKTPAALASWRPVLQRFGTDLCTNKPLQICFNIVKIFPAATEPQISAAAAAAVAPRLPPQPPRPLPRPRLWPQAPPKI